MQRIPRVSVLLHGRHDLRRAVNRLDLPHDIVELVQADIAELEPVLVRIPHRDDTGPHGRRAQLTDQEYLELCDNLVEC